LLGRRDKADEGLTLLRQDAEHANADPLTLVTFASLLVKSDGDPAHAQRLRERAAALARPTTKATPAPEPVLATDLGRDDTEGG
jgi:hypothetical protein